MKQSLQLRLGQQLTLTPQLQQAIRLLQLSTLDLTQEIQDALNNNLMLERDEEEMDTDSPTEDKPENLSNEQTLELNNQHELPDELPVDSQWDDIYDTPIYESSNHSTDHAEPLALTLASNPKESLYEHLTHQLDHIQLSNIDQAIAICIIDSINDDGYLTCSLPDIQDMLDQADIEESEVLMVLHLIQSLEPVGIAARDLQECLSLQLRQLEPCPFLEKTQQLIDQQFDALSQQNHLLIKRKLNINDEQLIAIHKLIRTLNPKPGAKISDKEAQYVTPDVFVIRHKNKWSVSLNPETTPKLRINASYAGLIKRADSSKDNVTLKDHMQEAKWFLKNLMNRNETVLKVASKIVELQRPFFDYGEEAMRPLVLKDIATELDLHESTISRVTTQKYMHTPRGTLEFKYFFSSHVSTSSGGECSATAIRALIKKFIVNEQPNKPLSDNKLSGLLTDQGIKVARRTVAKYRESMAIPPSNERKRLC